MNKPSRIINYNWKKLKFTLKAFNSSKIFGIINFALVLLTQLSSLSFFVTSKIRVQVSDGFSAVIMAYFQTKWQEVLFGITPTKATYGSGDFY